ncbi:hypothetical protein L6164_027653 [Bauhinia variegata]|uniref:Uncharacterized protein n=1 Tax=Bauhinia variegata TaxID=167791 RepID=A0ACB9LUK5_BAUVA|nr:hypothetical protein L6164_027653 [Bauhinia variegata]
MVRAREGSPSNLLLDSRSHFRKKNLTVCSSGWGPSQKTPNSRIEYRKHRILVQKLYELVILIMIGP